jgi:hypothetical protein
VRKTVGITVCAFGLAVAGCSGGGATTAAHPYPKPPHGQNAGIKPAHILPPDSAPYGGAIIGPVRNGWVAEAGRLSTVVYAGGQGYGRGHEGLLLISRMGQAPRTDRVEVPEAGAIKIIHVPLGRKVVTSAQKHGNIEFTSTNGVAGTLHLKDDTVTLDR